MRVVVLGFFIAVGVIYSSGALYFWTQEQSAQSLEAARASSPADVHHPEATLALIRDGMEQNDFSPRMGELVERSSRQLPSFYQPPVYRAIYHATRLEEPARTHEAFAAALRRFPANGRLHLDYARWLLMAPSRFPGVSDPEAPGRLLDLAHEAEEHLKIAMRVELNLTEEAIETLRQYAVAPERWAELLPDDLDARRQLVLALARDGHRDEALAHLRPLLARTTDVRQQREAALWALSWGDPNLTLEAVEQWKKNAKTGNDAHEPGLVAARAHIALGQMDKAYDVFRATLKDVRPSSSAGLKLLCGMGEEYLRLRRVILAESIFTEATNYSPSYARALLGLARTHRQSGNDTQAIEYYQKVLRVDPENTYANRELGNLVVQRRLRGRD